MNCKSIFGVFLALLPFTIGCTGGSVVHTVFGGRAAYKIVRSASEFNAFLIDGANFELNRGEGAVDQFPILEGPTPVSQDLASKLVASLTSTKTYGWAYAKGCIPTPGVRIQFISDGESVDVVFCFECSMLEVYKDGKHVGGEDFDEGRPQIVRAMKKIFPDNAVIQGLPETGCGLGPVDDVND